MYLQVEPVIFELFPGMRIIVVVAYGIDNQFQRPELSAHWHTTWADAAAQARIYGNAQSHPHIQPWRDHFRAMGVSNKKFPSAIEALLRRVLKGEEVFHINPLVDFYHTVSLQFIVPVGGFDLDTLRAPLEVRLTHEGDRFQALDEDIPQFVPAGEVAYASGQTILTRHLMWRQARTGLLVPSTRSAVLVAEVPGAIGDDVVEEVRSALQTGLRKYFEVPAASFVLDKNCPKAYW